MYFIVFPFDGIDPAGNVALSYYDWVQKHTLYQAIDNKQIWGIFMQAKSIAHLSLTLVWSFDIFVCFLGFFISWIVKYNTEQLFWTAVELVILYGL